MIENETLIHKRQFWTRLGRSIDWQHCNPRIAFPYETRGKTNWYAMWLTTAKWKWRNVTCEHCLKLRFDKSRPIEGNQTVNYKGQERFSMDHIGIVSPTGDNVDQQLLLKILGLAHVRFHEVKSGHLKNVDSIIEDIEAVFNKYREKL